MSRMQLSRAFAAPGDVSLDGPEPGARAFVWGVWCLMTIAAAGFVAWYGVNVPLWDDYDIIPPLIGGRPVTIGWLWEQCNEHRIGLPKVILLAADRLAGNDIRAGMFLSVASLALLAAALIELAARLPGGPRPSDAFFPLLLLSPAHATNLLWSIQFAFVLPTALGTALLIPIAARPAWPGPRAAALAGGVMTLLPLCGGTGLAFVPALAFWLLGAAWAEGCSQRAGSWRRAALIALAPVPALALTMLYFRGFRKTIHPAASDGLLAIPRTGLQFLAGGVGVPAAWAWPASGVSALALVALALLFLGRTWLWQREERPRVLGLMAFLAASVSLAAAVGWGRGWAGERAGFQNRYITMAAPFWCWLACVFRLYSPPALGRLVPNALFAGLCVLAWPNAEAGRDHGRAMAASMEALTHDLLAGLPVYQIVLRHTPELHPSQDEVARFLPLLKRAGFGPFRFLHDNPPFRAERIPVVPADLALVRWDGHVAHVFGVDPQITFALPAPRHVAGIRIRYAHASPQGAPARFKLTWKRPGQRSYPDDGQRYANWFQPTGEGNETTIWIDETIDQFRIQPDNQPCEFRIDELVLLEPRREGDSPCR